ncbi:MAG TPA: PIG-L family deacetylase, partial [Thermoanaerobaculia bacterium]|nr:PIG-L family deacetylase [Thermoanaerobaculia bacterium]
MGVCVGSATRPGRCRGEIRTISNLFVFAHQDDEMAAVSRIAFEADRGSLVHCVFLTDGTAGNASADIRNRESVAVLTHIGVDASRILFIGSEIPIRDGTLVDHLDLALQQFESRMKGIEVSSIYCLAREGGHQDHDASHLIAAAFAQRRGMIDRCCEMPLYH